jgi:hypothetical protein
MIGGVGRAVVSSAVAASSKEISARFLCSSQPPTSSTPALLTRTSPHFSMVTTLVVPDGYVRPLSLSPMVDNDSCSFAYVPAALMATVFVTAWQSVRVGAARKAAGIAYPQRKVSASRAIPSLIPNQCTRRRRSRTLARPLSSSTAPNVRTRTRWSSCPWCVLLARTRLNRD